MTDKVLCPYCGAEMKLDRYDDGYEFGAAYYVCQECGSTSPTANTDAAAISAAQARYLPPNRPLTLDEVKALERDDMGYSCVWMENRRVYDANGQAYEDYPYPVVTADCIPNNQAYYKKYGIEYRVWLRKPTQAEMDAAGWGGDATDD